MKKEIIILVVIIGLGVFGLAGSRWLVNMGTNSIPGITNTEYRDERFAYQFFYPNTWTTKKVAFTPGYVEVFSEEKDYSLYFWFESSEEIKNMIDLEDFVKDLAEYTEKKQGFKTLKISPQQLGDLNGFAYDYQDKEGKVSRAYYVADFTPTSDQNIFVWTVGILNKTDSLEGALSDQEVQSILSSYRLLE